MSSTFSLSRRTLALLAVVAVIVVVGVVLVTQLRPRSDQEATGSTAVDAELPSYAVRVNESEISYEELMQAARRSENYYLNEEGLDASSLQGAEGEYFRLVLRHDAAMNLIRQRLVMEEAEARGITVNEADVEQAATDTYLALLGGGLSEQDLAQSLLRLGQTMDEFQEGLRAEKRLEMVGEALEIAVIGQISPTDEELEAYYGPRAALYDGAFADVKDQVRSDYNTEVSADRVAAWRAQILADAEIEFSLPSLSAFHVYKDDSDEGLARFEDLLARHAAYDPYVAYYIGRIYHARAVSAFGERLELQAKSERTAEEDARITELEDQQPTYEQRAVESYVAAVTTSDIEDAQLLSRILQLNPEPVTRDYIRGQQANLSGNVDGARQLFQSVIDRDPSFAGAYVALGDLALRAGDREAAIDWYGQAGNVAPEDVDVMVLLANAYIRASAYDRAGEMVDAVRALAPESPRGWVSDADLIANRMRQEAIELSTLESIEDPTADETEAIDVLREAIAEDYEQARTLYERAYAVGAGGPVLTKLGYVHLLAEAYADAEATFRLAVRVSSSPSEAFAGLANALLELGKTDESLLYYDLALEQSTSAARREQILRQMLELIPQEAAYRFLLGLALVEQGKWREAVTELTTVVSQDPSIIEAYVRLGQAYDGLGNPMGAIQALQNGLDVATTEAERERLHLAIAAAAESTVEEGQPLPQVGLESLLEVAKYRLIADDAEGALSYLTLIESMDPSFKPDEVRQLIESAGGTPAPESVPATP